MKISRRLIGLLASLVLIGANHSHGAVISDSGGFNFALSPGNQVVILDLFNPALGTLTGVTLTVNGTIQAAITAENDSVVNGNMSVNLVGTLSASAPGANPLTGIFQSAGPVAVSATDGTPGSGPDFHDFGLISGSNSQSAIAASVVPFIGPGTFNSTASGNGGFSVSGVTDSTLKITDFKALGVVTVTYTYDPVTVPEPSTFALGSVALVGLAGIRKRRRPIA